MAKAICESNDSRLINLAKARGGNARPSAEIGDDARTAQQNLIGNRRE
jgi:hypothetical protein